MTLNDFKSVEGDTATGIRSLPVQLGVEGAARFACLVMALPQVAVIALLFGWSRGWHAAIVALLLVGQIVLMRRLLGGSPRAGGLVQRHRHHPLRARHAGLRLRAPPIVGAP